MGGLPKLQDRFNLTKVSKKIIKAYVIGKKCNFFKRQIKGKVPYTISYNIKNAINKILKDIKHRKIMGCTILFSPAAASFDQFRNFEERGYYFKKIIKKNV